MASAVVQAFHNANMADEKRRVMLRIQNGTKASSPQIISYRRQHPDYKGMIPNSTGSRTTMFFQNKNDRDTPFAVPIAGGVIKDFRFAQQLLKQRAESSRAIDEIREGLPVSASPPELLSETESRMLELNNILDSLQDQIEVGDITITAVSDLKNITRLFVALLPTFSGEEFAKLQNFISDDIVLPLERHIRQSPNDNNASQVLNYFERLFNFIKAFASSINLSDADKRSRIKALVKDFFNIKGKEYNQLEKEADRLRDEERARAREATLSSGTTATSSSSSTPSGAPSGAPSVASTGVVLPTEARPPVQPSSGLNMEQVRELMREGDGYVEQIKSVLSGEKNRDTLEVLYETILDRPQNIAGKEDKVIRRRINDYLNGKRRDLSARQYAEWAKQAVKGVYEVYGEELESM